MMVWNRGPRWWASGLGAATLALVLQSAVGAVPATPTLFAPSVSGAQVTLAWSAVPGAAGYRLSLGVTPGTTVVTENVPAVTSITFTSPLVGTGYVRVQAFDATGYSAYSNEVTLSVGTTTPVPAAPVNLTSTLTGTTVTFRWAAGMGGGLPLGLVLEAGTAPGAANIGSFPLPLSLEASVPGVPPGTYFARIYAVNATGRSAPSNEVRVDMPVGGCVVPAPSVLTPSASGTTVSFSWTPAAGAAAYRLEVSGGPTGPVVLTQPFPGSTTTASYSNAPAGTYYTRIVSVSACGSETPSAVVPLTVQQPPPGGGPRTPNPAPGQRLPLPNMSAVVEAVARAFPNDLRNSCVEHGGNNAWLFRLVQELRRYDTRWGLNWKRGRLNDLSQDVVDYNFSADPDEGTTNVYIIDVIGGHCGNNPQPSWIDQTEATRQKGEIGRWTLRPYVAAGGTP